jgi:hypothetical protein
MMSIKIECDVDSYVGGVQAYLIWFARPISKRDASKHTGKIFSCVIERDNAQLSLRGRIDNDKAERFSIEAV